MRENFRTFRNGADDATHAPAAQGARPAGRLDGLASGLLLAANLLITALFVLPAAVEVTRNAREERAARAEGDRLAGEARKRQAVAAADALSKAERTRKLSEENLKLAEEINAKLKKGE